MEGQCPQCAFGVLLRIDLARHQAPQRSKTWSPPPFTAATRFTAAEALAVSKLAAAVQRGVANGQPPSMDNVCLKHQLSNATWSRYQDKHGVKDIVKRWSGGRIHTAATFLVIRHASNVTDVLISGLPESFVVKSSHGSGGVIIVEEGVPHCLKPPCIEVLGWQNLMHSLTLGQLAAVLRNQCRLLLHSRTVATDEVSYDHITPGCIFEELIAGPGSLLSELQVWVVGGQPFFLRHDIEYSGTRDRGGNAVTSVEPSRPLANYFTTDGHHIPGLLIRHDCEATAPAAYANHCLSPDHDRPTLPLTPATRKLLVDFSALAAEKTGAKVLRVSART